MLLGWLFAAAIPAGAVPISITGSSTYAQNFDSLASSGSPIAWVNGATLAGWYLFRQPAPGTGLTNYSAGDGSSTTGSFWSYGSTGSGERALGGLGSGGTYFGSPASGAIAGWIAVAFVNDSGGDFVGFAANWDGEQWRNGGNADAQAMVFEYGFGASFETVATWVAPGGGFDWSSPVHTSSAAALNGNLAANRVAGVGGTINASWASGQTLWLRWGERNDTGNDHGLAIDNFTFQATPAASVTDDGTTLLLLGVPMLGLAAWRRMRSCA